MLESALLATCLAGRVDPALVLAVVEHESGADPHALNVNGWEGERLRALDPDEVAVAAADFVAAGYTVDLGLMQINSANLERLGQTLESVLEPCTNLRLGERLLAETVVTAAERGLHHDEGLRAALSLYNTGSLEDGFANGYVEAVWSRYARHALERARTIGSRVDLEASPEATDDRRGRSSRVLLPPRLETTDEREPTPDGVAAAQGGGE